MERISLWSRFSEWVKSTRRALDWDSDLLPENENGNATAGGEEHNARRSSTNPSEPVRFRGTRARLSGLESESRQLAANFAAIALQMERYAESSQTAQRTLDRLATGVASVTEAVRTHGELLAAVQRRVDDQATLAHAARESVAQIAVMGASLKDATARLTTGLEDARRSGEIASASMTQLQQSVRHLSDSSTACRNAVDALREELSEKLVRWESSLPDIQRRLTWIASGAAAAALAAISIAVVALLR